MEYVDDEEIADLLPAIEKIADWAHDQLGSMRRPNKSSPQDAPAHEMDAPEGSPLEEAMESPEEEQMEQPMDAPPPRDFGLPPKKEEKTILEVIEPGVGMKKPMSRYGEKHDGFSNMDEKGLPPKLDKFGRKPRR